MSSYEEQGFIINWFDNGRNHIESFANRDILHTDCMG
jgi:hypothetical protein